MKAQSLISLDEAKLMRELRNEEYEKNKRLGLPDPLDILDQFSGKNPWGPLLDSKGKEIADEQKT